MSGTHTPGPAEILRAVQKDKDFVQRIDQELTDLVQQILGQRFWLQYRVWLEHASKVVYYALTNLAGFQTLGEEYAGIVQVDSSFRKVPSRKRIAFMILFHTLGKLFLEKVLKNVQAFRSTNDETSSLVIGQIHDRSNWFKTAGAKIAEITAFCLPLLTQFHLTLFFFSGKFYDFSKRLTGIHYILVRKWFGNQTQQSLKYLMWLSVFNLSLTILRDTIAVIVARHEKSKLSSSPSSTSHELSKTVKNNVETSVEDNSGKKCSLCLEVRRHPSVTPCGHIYCWECILDWLRTKEECPICRDQVSPSRVVPLQNYC